MSSWDTNETYVQVSNDVEMKAALMDCIGNELQFCWVLFNIITIHNNRLTSEGYTEMKINPANVNGNEIYVDFCCLIGNEQKGWCQK